jgi:hypothetical protein
VRHCCTGLRQRQLTPSPPSQQRRSPEAAGLADGPGDTPHVDADAGGQGGSGIAFVVDAEVRCAALCCAALRCAVQLLQAAAATCLTILSAGVAADVGPLQLRVAGPDAGPRCQLHAC